MEFWTAVSIVRRRWYVVVVCAILIAFAAVGIVKKVKPSYQATGSLAMIQIGQPTSSTDNANNPFGSLADFTPLVAAATQDSAFQDALVRKGASGTYAVEASITNSQLLLLSTTASSPEGALSSYRTLVQLVKQEIVKQQTTANTPPQVRYGTQGITTPSRTTKLVGSRVKAMILLAVVGTLLTLVLVFLFDSFAESRRRKRDERMRAVTKPSLFDRQSGTVEPLELLEAVKARPRRETYEPPRSEAAGS